MGSCKPGGLSRVGGVRRSSDRKPCKDRKTGFLWGWPASRTEHPQFWPHQDSITIDTNVNSCVVGGERATTVRESLELLCRARLATRVQSTTEVNIKTTEGVPVQYRLISLPFFLAGQLSRLLDQA